MSAEDPQIEVGSPVNLGDSFMVSEPVQIGAVLALALSVDLTEGVALASPVRIPVLTVSADGQRVWVGEGSPTVIPGASPNDLYLDEDTGVLYRLE